MEDVVICFYEFIFDKINAYQLQNMSKMIQSFTVKSEEFEEVEVTVLYYSPPIPFHISVCFFSLLLSRLGILGIEYTHFECKLFHTR